MSFKAFIFLGLLFAIVVLFASEEVAVTATDVKSEEAMMETGGVDDVKRGGVGRGRFRFVGGGGGHHGHNHCHHGCCHHHHSGCSRCCSFAGEAVDAEPQAKPNN